MPLRILKRNSKQYNVVSKSTFVISVELLDNGVMECTLDADSTGRDCLLNISQRLGLHQPEFFGLRYISRGVPPRQRWTELDRPLRKQLDKNAQDSQLSLGVMFYVNDVNLLKDEMARYHYFLQLKSDVIDGKLNCSIEQAISLAAYSLQAEFGDFDAERHTIEYLRDFAILPKDLISEQKYPHINILGLYEACARQYASLIGFPPPLAEIYYIMVTQQLDGYGQAAYPAKDDAGNDILICVSANGLIIRRRDWTHIAAFRWVDIKSLIGHKRLFVVESSQSHRTMQYHFTDAEVAKYVRKICLLQSKFYKENIQSMQGIAENQQQQAGPYPQRGQARNGGMMQIIGGDHVDGQHHAPSSYFSGVTPDLLAPTLHQSTTSSSFISGASSSFNQSQSEINLSSSGFHPQFLHNSTILEQQQQQPILFHHPGELHQMQVVPTMRTNPLADAEQYSNGYGKAVSDYAAALAQYGKISGAAAAVLGDSSVPKSSSQGYFTSGGGGGVADNRNQKRGPFEDEPIYQNEIVSQIHSMELRESLSNSEISDLNGNPSTLSAKPASTAILPNLNLMKHHQKGILEEGVCATAIAHPLYVFKPLKPPPPYPGLRASTSNSNSSSSLQNNNYSNQLSTSSSNTSLPVNGKETTTSDPCSIVVSKLSPSATSAVVSAQVHSIPDEDYEPVEVMENGRMESPSPARMEELVAAASNKSVEKDVPVSSSKSQKTPQRVDIPILKPIESASATTQTHKNKAGHLYGKPIDPVVLREFQSIAKTKVNPNFTTALKRENSKRNRCPEVLPYEDNAIRLSISKHNPTGYINASPLSIMVGDRQWLYIASQLPLPGNGPSLWQMVWEAEIKVIVSLERDSSAPFYPTQKGMAAMTFNDFQVMEGKSERKNSASIAREFTIIHLPKKRQRKVWLLPYEEEWKDDVPVHTEHFLCFLEEVNSIQRKFSDPSSPLTVVCGTGAGRSGIFILSDLLLHAADSGHKLRCDAVLRDLRNQRMSLVTTASQYAFVLHILAKYLAQSRLI